jgi:hypothetical protein
MKQETENSVRNYSSKTYSGTNPVHQNDFRSWLTQSIVGFGAKGSEENVGLSRSEFRNKTLPSKSGIILLDFLTWKLNREEINSLYEYQSQLLSR